MSAVVLPSCWVACQTIEYAMLARPPWCSEIVGNPPISKGITRTLIYFAYLLITHRRSSSKLMMSLVVTQCGGLRRCGPMHQAKGAAWTKSRKRRDSRSRWRAYLEFEFLSIFEASSGAPCQFPQSFFFAWLRFWFRFTCMGGQSARLFGWSACDWSPSSGSHL